MGKNSSKWRVGELHYLTAAPQIIIFFLLFIKNNDFAAADLLTGTSK
jgi:hypothetical protein